MVDPEVLHKELVSGNSATLRGQADTVQDAMKKVDQATTRITEAADRPKWTSATSAAYMVRTAGVTQGIKVNYFILGRMETTLRTAAKHYDAMETKATAIIKPWRDRPAGLNTVVEELLALLVNAQLIGARAAYSAQLTTLASFATGEELDPDDLDAETRKWLKVGMDKTAEWLKEHGGGMGPLIPNLGLLGDDRRLIPQGLGLDPDTGWIIQTSYSDKPGQNPVLSMVDPKTEREMVDVELGGYTRGPDERFPPPDHAGGVASDGKYTYVTSSGKPSHVYTYLNSDLQKGGKGPVSPVRPPMEIPDGAGAYGTLKDGALYVGTHVSNIGGGGNKYDGAHDDGRLYRYLPDGQGGWKPDPDFGGGAGYIHTPPQAQGVVVRDGEYIFSTSLGRGNPGRLIVQDRQDDQPGNGERGDAYELPNMSEGIIELDGQIIATYESGADAYGPHDEDTKDPADLWMNPHMTKTDLAALGLSDDIDVDTGSLKAAAKEFDGAAGPLGRASDLIGGIAISKADLGQVPAASTLATALNTEIGTTETSLNLGVQAVHRTSEGLSFSATIYTKTDEYASGMLRPPSLR